MEVTTSCNIQSSKRKAKASANCEVKSSSSSSLKRPRHLPNSSSNPVTPILQEKDIILKTIAANVVTVLTLETGSDKTVLIAQFLWEAGYCDKGKVITIIEPWKVSVVSCCQLVAQQINHPFNIVAWKLVNEDTSTESSKMLFQTDLTLFDELRSDQLLTKYSIICIDYAHQRTLYSDLLIGVLSRVVRIRADLNDPLKLVILTGHNMDDCFSKAGVFHSPPAFIYLQPTSRNVDIHYSRLTPTNPISEAIDTVWKINNESPPGGIMVFVAATSEVVMVTEKLVAAHPPHETTGGLDVLPFHANLSVQELNRLFITPPGANRLCVVTTNVAETLLPIPSIRYVIDTGKTSVTVWNKLTGVASCKKLWISKPSADERTKSAGLNGICYRLYSLATHESEFSDQREPAIVTEPTDKLILCMKSVQLRKVCNFPYITHPGVELLRRTERLLVDLQALEMFKTSTTPKPLVYKSDNARITDVGRHLFLFPVAANFAKILDASFQHSLSAHVIAIIAALSVDYPFLEGRGEQNCNKQQAEWKKLRRNWLRTKELVLFGDMMILLTAIKLFEEAIDKEEFCRDAGLNFTVMQKTIMLRRNLTSRVNNVVAAIQQPPVVLSLRNLTEEEAIALRQIFLSGHPHSVAKRMDTEEMDKEQKSKYKYAYLSTLQEEPVFLHYSSVLRTRNPPKWVVYLENFESNGQLFISKTFAVEEEWITPKNITENMRMEVFFYGLPDIYFNKLLHLFVPKLEPVCNGMLLIGRNKENQKVVVFPAGIVNLYTSNTKFVEGRSTTACGHDWTLMERMEISRVLKNADKIFMIYYTYILQSTGRKSRPAYIEVEERSRIGNLASQAATHATMLYYEKAAETWFRVDTQTLERQRKLESKNFQAVKHFLTRRLYLDFRRCATVKLTDHKIYDVCALVGINTIIQLFNHNLDKASFDPMFGFGALMLQTLEELSELGYKVGGIVPTFTHLQAINKQIVASNNKK